jgi:hypothetical protein
VDTAGRIDKFKNRYQRHINKSEAKAEEKADAKAEDKAAE